MRKNWRGFWFAWPLSTQSCVRTSEGRKFVCDSFVFVVKAHPALTAKTQRGFWSKEFSMRTRIAAFTFGVLFFLGCCSATPPGAAESDSRGAEALRSGAYDKARAHFEDALKSRADEASEAGLLQVLR